MPPYRRRPQPSVDQSTRLADVPTTVSELRERLAEVLHDVHTPLAALSLLALPETPDGSPEDDARGQLRRAVTALRRQTQVLRDHPDFRSHPILLASTRCEFSAWLAELHPILAEIAEARGVSLDWEVPVSGGVFHCDPQRLSAAVEHLFLQRSWRSTRPGRLRVQAHAEASELRLLIGGSEALVPDPFAAQDRMPVGVEFALEVLAAHGATVCDFKGENGWREWRIAIPRPSDSDSLLDSDPSVDTDSLSRVLVVEDDQALRELLTDLLSIRYPVVACRDASEALQSLETGFPDLMVVDHGLPDGTGLELAQKIRDLCGERIPLLLVTGSTASDGLDRLERMHVLTKPFRGTDLLARSAALLKSGCPATKPLETS